MNKVINTSDSVNTPAQLNLMKYEILCIGSRVKDKNHLFKVKKKSLLCEGNLNRIEFEDDCELSFWTVMVFNLLVHFTLTCITVHMDM